MSNVNSFSEYFYKLRTEKGLSQQQLAIKLFVDRSTISNWEHGKRIPDVTMMTRIAQVLETDISKLLSTTMEAEETPNVILLDDEDIILQGGLKVLEKALPSARLNGFMKVSEAMSFARENRIAIAFLDIEMGRQNGLDVCEELLQIDPFINVIFLTSYREYSLNAWNTGACGYIMKPLTVERVMEQLDCLRYPVKLSGAGT